VIHKDFSFDSDDINYHPQENRQNITYSHESYYKYNSYPGPHLTTATPPFLFLWLSSGKFQLKQINIKITCIDFYMLDPIHPPN